MLGQMVCDSMSTNSLFLVVLSVRADRCIVYFLRPPLNGRKPAKTEHQPMCVDVNVVGLGPRNAGTLGKRLMSV